MELGTSSSPACAPSVPDRPGPRLLPRGLVHSPLLPRDSCSAARTPASPSAWNLLERNGAALHLWGGWAAEAEPAQGRAARDPWPAPQDAAVGRTRCGFVSFFLSLVISLCNFSTSPGQKEWLCLLPATRTALPSWATCFLGVKFSASGRSATFTQHRKLRSIISK